MSDRLDYILANESALIPKIQMEQRTLRLAKLVATWGTFIQTEHWWEMEKELSAAQVTKYRAWWDLILTVLRHEEDTQSLTYAIAMVVKEKAKRSYSKELEIKPKLFDLTEDEASKIREYVLTNFEGLV